jgi:hypothetical protein
MPCDVSCDKCEFLGKQCDGTMEEEENEYNETKECGESCGHFDSINQCCWQATEKGLCFTVSEGDSCHLGYKENDFR